MYGQGKKVLVIDDEPVMGRFFGAELENSGFDVEIADSGMGGINRFWEIGKHIDYVVMDLQMPDRNGAEVAEALRHIVQDRRWEKPGLYLHTGSPDVGVELQAIKQRGLVDEIAAKGQFNTNFRDFAQRY